MLTIDEAAEQYLSGSVSSGPSMSIDDAAEEYLRGQAPSTPASFVPSNRQEQEAYDYASELAKINQDIEAPQKPEQAQQAKPISRERYDAIRGIVKSTMLASGEQNEAQAAARKLATSGIRADERPWFLKAVSEEAAQNGRYKDLGTVGRIARAPQQGILQAIQEVPRSWGGSVLDEMALPDQDFYRQLLSARQQGDPLAGKDAGWLMKSAVAAGQMAPESLATGIGAVAGGPVGTGAAISYWYTRMKPQAYDDARARGLSPVAAERSSDASAIGQAVTEMFLEKAPFLGKLLQNGVRSTVKKAVWNYAKSAGKEASEEGVQSLINHVSATVVGKLEGEKIDGDWRAAWKDATEQTLAAIGPSMLLAAPGGMIDVATSKKMLLDSAAENNGVPSRAAVERVTGQKFTTQADRIAIAKAVDQGPHGTVTPEQANAENARIAEERLSDPAASSRTTPDQSPAAVPETPIDGNANDAAGPGDTNIGRTSSEKAGSPIPKVGMMVRPTDKNNIGTVASVDPDRQVASVSFYNKKDGTRATREFTFDRLRSMSGESFAFDNLKWAEKISSSTPKKQGEALAGTPERNTTATNPRTPEPYDGVDQPQAEGVQTGRQDSSSQASPPTIPQEGKEARGYELGAGPVLGSIGDFNAIAGKVGRNVPAMLKKYFTKEANMPPEAFEAKWRHDAKLQEQVRLFSDTLKDFRDSVRKAFGGKPTDAEVLALDNAWKGKVGLDSIPEPVRTVIERMRAIQDGISAALVSEGVSKGGLSETIIDNLGEYSRRTYKAFTEKGWAEKVPEPVKENARQWYEQAWQDRKQELREKLSERYPDRQPEQIEATVDAKYPELSQEQIRGKIESYLFRGTQATSPLQAMRDAKIGRKDLAIFKRRKDIPKPLRDLWGENLDAGVNFFHSAMSSAKLLENHRFLSEVKEAGMGKWLFDTPIENKNGRFIAPIAGEGTKSMEPLNGLFTTPEIAEAFQAVSPNAMWWPVRQYMKAVGLAKYAKTVLSWSTHISNLVANTGFLMAGGDWRIMEAYEAARATTAGLGLSRSASAREAFRKMVGLGVTDAGPRLGEFLDVIHDATGKSLDELKGSPAAIALRAILRVPAKAYAAEDYGPKIYAFANEYKNYRAAYPQWSEKQVSEYAARIVRDRIPTYSMTSRFIKGTRRVPLIGPFASFWAETIRCGKNLLALTAKELQDPATRSIGMRRAVGILAAGTITGTVAIMSRQRNGVDDQEDKDYRRFMAPWDKNNVQVYVSVDNNGDASILNLGRYDPWQYFKQPVIALMNGDDLQTALVNGVKEFMSPLTSPDILTKAVAEAVMNKKMDTGGVVYNPQDPQWHLIIAEHIGKAMKPSTVDQANRIKMGFAGEVGKYGQKYGKWSEVAYFAAGARPTSINVRQGLAFKAHDFTESMQNAQRIYNSVATRQGTVTPEELSLSYAKTESARKAVFDEMRRDVEAAIRLTRSRFDVNRILKDSGISNDMRSDLLSNRYRPYRPSDQILRKTNRSIRPMAK